MSLQGQQPHAPISRGVSMGQRIARATPIGNVGLRPHNMRTGIGGTQRSTVSVDASQKRARRLSVACSTNDWRAPALISSGETAKHHIDARPAWRIGALPKASSVSFDCERLPSSTRARHAVVEAVLPEGAVAEMGSPSSADRDRKDTDGGARASQGMMAGPQSKPVTPAQLFGFSAKASVLLAAAVLVWTKIMPKLKDVVVPLLRKAAPALKAAVALYVVSLIWKPFAFVKDFVLRQRQSAAVRSRQETTHRTSAAAEGKNPPAFLPEAVEVGTVASTEPPRIKPQQTSSERHKNGIMTPSGSRAAPLPMAPRVAVTPGGGGGMASQEVLKFAVYAAVLGGMTLLRRESSSSLPRDAERRAVDC